jgi:hypothetical protein
MTRNPDRTDNLDRIDRLGPRRPLRLTRRAAALGSAKLVLGGGLGLATVAGLAGRALAQATPAALDLSAYPEVKVTNTDAAVTLSTATVPAGLVLLTVSNKMTSSENGGGSSVIGPPSGMGMADFVATVQQQLATPEAGQFFPAIAYQAVLLGGPGNIDPGQTGQAIVNVPAGQWAVTGIGNQPFAMLTATGGSPSAAPQPTAAVTVTEIDFGFAGFDHVPAGPQIWQVVHNGTQPHMLLLIGVPAGTTLEQVTALFASFMTGTPAANGLDPSQIRDAGGVDVQSAGTTVWPVLNLDAGRYAAVCFVPDPNKNYEPHALEGMISVFDAGA